MICCDKCEEWFHGKCVGISRARGAEMEKNNEEYVCPQCIKQTLLGEQVTSTEVAQVKTKLARINTQDMQRSVELELS